MISKPITRRKVRVSDPPKPPAAKPLPPGASRKSLVPKGVKLQAQRLIHRLGSAELAKKVIDDVAESESGSDFLEDMFATRWGFESRKQLFAASRPVFPHDHSNWWATRLALGR